MKAVGEYRTWRNADISTWTEIDYLEAAKFMWEEFLFRVENGVNIYPLIDSKHIILDYLGIPEIKNASFLCEYYKNCYTCPLSENNKCTTFYFDLLGEPIRAYQILCIKSIIGMIESKITDIIIAKDLEAMDNDK